MKLAGMWLGGGERAGMVVVWAARKGEEACA